ncbi:MAG: hypothetical protein V4598_12765 [Bdellovibrionota bacterium]
MRTVFTLLSLMLLLVSCSGKGPSQAKFKLEMSGFPLAATALGGVVLFGDNGKDRFTRVVDSDSTDLELPPGAWKIGAIAWAGPEPMSGNVICALTDAQIEGETSSVKLNLDNPTCFTSSFSTETGPTAGAINPQFCEDDVSSFTGSCNYNPTGFPEAQKRGFVGSYRFSILSGQSFASTTTSKTILETHCYQSDSNQTSDLAFSVASLNIPTFVAGLGIPLNADAYLGEDCEAGKGMLRASFDNPGVARFDAAKRAYVRTPMALICLESRKYPGTGFASGQGNNTWPYVICTNDQLKSLQVGYNATIASNYYILGDDINLITGIQRGTASAYDPDLEIGDTFIPLGLYFDGSGDIQSHAIPFSGGFDGNGKTIHHFRFHNNNELTKTGFISDMSGAYFASVKFDKPAVEGGDFTGVAVGYSSNTEFFDVVIDQGEIRGDDQTGGIVGYANGTSTTIEHCHVKKTEVEGKTWTGGLVGRKGIGYIQRATFDGNIYAENGSSKIGGIAGESQSHFTEVFSSGYLRSESTVMGGIVGQISGKNLEMSGSSMLIKDLSSFSASPRFIGGMLGNAMATVNTDRNMFRGHIESPCSPGACEIGGISGSAVASNVFNFSTGSYADGAGEDGDMAFTLASALTVSAVNHVCNGYGAGCPWTQMAGDYPRLPTDVNHPCNNAVNILSPAFQAASPHFRGSAANPILICNPDHLSVTGFAKNFKVMQDLNLSQASSNSGSLTGNIDFNNQIVHSLKLQDTGSEALFSLVSAGSTVKNALLINFRITDTTSCGSCNKAILTNINAGTILNAEVRDSEVSVNTIASSAMLGGIATINNTTGKISGSRVKRINMKGYRMGGVVFNNFGTIENTSAEPEMDGFGSPADYVVGGVAGYNYGLIDRVVFEGKINNTDNNTPTSGVGGIAGVHALSGAIPEIINSEVSQRAIINFFTPALSGGGLVGYSSSLSNKITKSIMQGFILEASASTSISGILGAGNFSPTAVYDFTATNFLRQPTASVSITYSAPYCDYNFTSSDFIPVTLYGAVKINDKFSSGSLTRIAAGSFLIRSTESENHCEEMNDMSMSMGNTADLFESRALPTVPTPVALRLAGYDLARFDITLEKKRILDAYLAYLKGEPLVSPPVWVYEPEEDGIRLFRIND